MHQLPSNPSRRTCHMRTFPTRAPLNSFPTRTPFTRARVPRPRPLVISVLFGTESYDKFDHTCNSPTTYLTAYIDSDDNDMKNTSLTIINTRKVRNLATRAMTCYYLRHTFRYDAFV